MSVKKLNGEIGRRFKVREIASLTLAMTDHIMIITKKDLGKSQIELTVELTVELTAEEFKLHALSS